jgi:hypothetical protein
MRHRCGTADCRGTVWSQALASIVAERWSGVGDQGEQLVSDHGGRRFAVEDDRADPEHLRLEHGVRAAARQQPRSLADRAACLAELAQMRSRHGRRPP